MSMWNFKAGDKVFCVWPKKDIDLEGGEHVIQSVEGQYVRIEGISRYIHNWRFIKVPEDYVNPERQKKMDDNAELAKQRNVNLQRFANWSNSQNSAIGDCEWTYSRSYSPTS